MDAESSFHRYSVPEEDHTVEAEVGVGPEGEADQEDGEVIVGVGVDLEEEGVLEDPGEVGVIQEEEVTVGVTLEVGVEAETGVIPEAGVAVIPGEEVTQDRIQDEWKKYEMHNIGYLTVKQ